MHVGTSRKTTCTVECSPELAGYFDHLALVGDAIQFGNGNAYTDQLTNGRNTRHDVIAVDRVADLNSDRYVSSNSELFRRLCYTQIRTGAGCKRDPSLIVSVPLEAAQAQPTGQLITCE